MSRPGARWDRTSTRFAVWAPSSDTVDLVVGQGDAVPMSPDDRGWFAAEVKGLDPGARYRYRLDDATDRPDPASLSQPEGVHGPSEVVDLSFPWSDAGWSGPPLDEQILYELHIGTFTPEGTFDAAIERLAHLVDLGVTTVEVMPVAQFPGRRNWGYDGVALYAVQDSYGGPAGLQRFVDACHGAGLSVLLDVVYNHLGPEGNHLHAFGPYFTDRYRTPWGDAVNLDGPGSDDVRNFLVENALMWVTDFRLDGLRLDAVHALFDRSARPFVDELADALHRRGSELGRRVHVIAENELNDPRVVRSVDAGGAGLDAAWNDDFHHALHVALTGETRGYYTDFSDPVSDLATAVSAGYVNAGRFSPHRGHSHGAPSADLPRSSLVAFAQNHDQIGNRARGDRLSTLVDPAATRLAAGLVLLSPWVPMLFQGEEWAESRPFLYFVDHGDPELVEAVRRGRAAEFAGFIEGDDPDVPDPAAASTHEASLLEWSSIEDPPHAAVLELHRALIGARRVLPSLRSPEPANHVVGRDGPVLSVVGTSPGPATAAIFNLSDRTTTTPLPAGTWRRRLDGAEARFGGPGAQDAAAGEATLGPWGFALYIEDDTDDRTTEENR